VSYISDELVILYQ